MGWGKGGLCGGRAGVTTERFATGVFGRAVPSQGAISEINLAEGRQVRSS